MVADQYIEEGATPYYALANKTLDNKSCSAWSFLMNCMVVNCWYTAGVPSNVLAWYETTQFTTN